MRNKLALIFAYSVLIFPVACFASENLSDILQIAQDNDPTLQSARAANRANHEALPQAKSFFLPEASISANYAENDQSQTTGGGNNENAFARSSLTLSVRQPIYHQENYPRYKSAKKQLQLANLQLLDAEQDLISRTAERYFAVLGARDNVAFNQVEIEATARQLEQSKNRFEVGLNAITEVHEAQARYDLVVAEEIAAKNQLANTQEDLRELTGQYHEELSVLQDNLPLEPAQPADLEHWSDLASQQNIQVRIARINTQLAKLQVKLQQAGHYPRLDLVGSHQINDTESSFGGTNAISIETEQSAIALQLNLSLYQGNRIASLTRQATHQLEQAKSEMQAQTLRAVNQTRQAYLGLAASISRIKALAQAVRSSQSALEATQAGYEVGTRTIVEVLNAQRDHNRAKRDYALERYSYILNLLRLQRAAGSLSGEDIAQLDRYFSD